MDPSRVGPYQIEHKIGAGGMGTVYLGRHVETGREAAVKVLPPSLAREEGFVARFNREIDALTRLANPHIVQFYDSGIDGDTYYYAMEYVPGETLTSRLLRDKRIEWREVIALSLQICTALKAAHDAGVVHRDLKPSNLLIMPDGTLKLTDFGVAQVFAGGKLTITGGIIGTAEYMSPEQAEGRRATKKSDLYSLGAVMYVMLTGRPPFTGQRTLDVIQKHKYGRFDRPGLFVPDIPRWLEEIVCQLLEKDPDRRFPDAYVLARRLQEVVRKVELSSDQQTLTADHRAFDGTSPTLAALPHSAEPGVGTLMRDLVRAEIDATMQPGPLGHLLNSTWVLVALLLLLVVGGVFWFRERELTPAEMFQAGTALMEKPEGSEWLEARDRYFEPLIDTDPDRWGEQVAPFLERIELYELAARLETRRRRPVEPSNEAARFLQLARQYELMGDAARAEQTLAALVALLNDQPAHQSFHRLAEQRLEELRTARNGSPDGPALLQSALKRADRLAADGRQEEAAEVWTGIVHLYGNDPAARSFVETARQRLEQPPP